MLYYVIRDNTELVGTADSFAGAELVKQEDSELQKAMQFIKKRFLKRFLKKKVSLATHEYKICVAVKMEVSENEVFHS